MSAPINDEENTPLLQEESNEQHTSPNFSRKLFKEPRDRIRAFFQKEVGECHPISGSRHSDLVSGSSSDECRLRLQAQDSSIIAVFVVAFDTRSGNVIEWCLPINDFNLDGLEFKAMVSGGHRLHSDFLYFKKDNLYGISCFENMPVESQLERGARMKSVGILTTSYRNLHCHKPFLEIQVRKLLEDPGNYDILEDFYEKKKGVLHEQSDNSSSTYLTADSTRSYPSATDGHSHLKNLHPAGCFLQFVQFFGERIFILWKFALLRKRILFYSSPPIGAVCYRVYCAMCLVEHGIAGLSESLVPIQPLFYVNVADIESIEEEISYIACTTEKIFETKTRLFDVYIDKEKLLTHSPTLKNINHVNSSDRNKFKKLNKISVGTSKKTEDDSFDDEDTFIVRFFRELNERLFRTLLEASASHDRRLTANHMRSIGLHPRADRDFISRVAETYNIDVVLATEHPCCPLLFD